MKYCPFHVERDDVQAVDGFSVCQRCADRLFNELHWIADMYGPLLQALTHRLNVEKAEQVKVSGGKDPMVRGMDLNDDAMDLRHAMRGIAYAGIGWLVQRNPDFHGRADAEPGGALRFIARHLHWLLSDPGPEIGKWGARVIATRIAAEDLVTPAIPKARIIQVPNLRCQHLAAGIDGKIGACGSAMHTYNADSNLLVCDTNPAHTVSRETAIRKRLAKSNKAGANRLLAAILER